MNLNRKQHSITDRAGPHIVIKVLTILTSACFESKIHFYRSVWNAEVTGGRYLGIVTSLIRWWDKSRRKRKLEDQNSKLLSCCDVMSARLVVGACVARCVRSGVFACPYNCTECRGSRGHPYVTLLQSSPVQSSLDQSTPVQPTRQLVSQLSLAQPLKRPVLCVYRL